MSNVVSITTLASTPPSAIRRRVASIPSTSGIRTSISTTSGRSRRASGDTVQLPTGLDLTAYRLVQEGLTNALKHSRASHAEVLVHYRHGQIELVVSDDGLGCSDADGGGRGLVGMRERVSVYGGELEAGPRPEGGFRL